MKTRIALRNRKTRGFSLIELMLVIAILGVLGLVVVRNVIPEFAKSQVTVAKTNIETIKGVIKSYRMGNGLKLPPTLEELLLPNDNNMGEPYLENREDIIDPWGNEYQYIVQGNKFEIISLGADGQEGGEGENADISSLGEDRGNSGF